MIKKNTGKKYISKSLLRQSSGFANESVFWKKIALEQQALIHAKNNT